MVRTFSTLLIISSKAFMNMSTDRQHFHVHNVYLFIPITMTDANLKFLETCVWISKVVTFLGSHIFRVAINSTN